MGDLRDYQPSFDDYVLWVEEIVIKYGVEIDIFAWQKIKERITEIKDGE